MISLPLGRPEKRPAASYDITAIRAERGRLADRAARARPPLTRLLAVPRRVELGINVLHIGELTLADVATLQEFLGEVRYGTPEAAASLGSDAGRLLLLNLVARPETPAAALVAALVAAANPDQWAEVERIAFGVTARMEEMARSSPNRELATGIDWESWLWAVVDRTGWDFDRIGRLTLTQARFVANAGKLPESTSAFSARAGR